MPEPDKTPAGPDMTPEGILIEAAREQAGLSARKAARRAGISDAWWHQIVRGRRGSLEGQHILITGPPATVAKMARAVRVTPEQMETAGQRPDAAAEMRKERPVTPLPPRRPATRRPVPESPDDTLRPMLEDHPDVREQIQPYYDRVAGQVASVLAALPEGMIPPGQLVFTCPDEQWAAAEWDCHAGLYSPDGKRWTISDLAWAAAARFRQAAIAARQDESGII